MKKIFITLMFFLLMSQIIIAEDASYYANLLTSQLSSENVQYAILKDGQIIASGVSGSDVTKNTIYPIASISKMYTTAAIMKLVDENKINLDNFVTDYIPTFTMLDPRYKDITIRMLLNHSSGLMGDSLSNALMYGGKINSDNLLFRLSSARLKSDPGEFSVYSNDGYAILEKVIEFVTQQTYEEYLRSAFLDPLNLKQTYFSTENISGLPIVNASKSLYLGDMTRPKPELYSYVGVGGILATAQDVCKFMHIFLSDTILSEHSVETTKYPEYLRGIWHANPYANLAFGLGWDNVNVDPFYDVGLQILLKNGDLLGAHGTVVAIPNLDAIICVLSTGGYGVYNQMVALELTYNILCDHGYYVDLSLDTSLVNKFSTNSSSLVHYSGVYANFYTDYTIKISSNGLLTISSNQFDIPPTILYYKGNGTFISPTNKYSVKFIQESNGHIYLESNNLIYIGLVPIYHSQYELVKLHSSPTLLNYEQAWLTRAGSKYYLVSEYYPSILYTAQPFFVLPSQSSIPGYLGPYKIIDEKNAINIVQIPQNNGRNISDLKIQLIDNIEYLHFNNNIYISEQNINILSKNINEVVIGSDGYAQWFFTSDYSDYIDVTIHGPGTFNLYNSNGDCLYSSYLEFKPNPISLDNIEKIMFVGDPGTKFQLKS
ncbi:MAG: hypothetical protein ATN31_05465 [Candidatus Epulonipiscioides saccharophilum]|nr:MAG: hypothetical protein ATN31_05465 [Epulopiscium sp. AS2M-Bin001]